MSGTAQTIATLYAQNPDNTSGQIVPADNRNIIATLQVRTPFFNVQLPEYAGGAPNAGASRPASTRFGSLGALTAAVGGTTLSGVTLTLNMELDWIATQMAINAAAVNGGTVYSPAGAGYYYSNANSAADGSGQLVFPATSTATSWNMAVSWSGGELGGSQHHWPSDLGSGKAAVVCAGRPDGESPGLFSGLTLYGPGTGASITWGTATAAMSGILSIDRRSMRDCYITGFWAGLDIVGGQAVFHNLLIEYCYYCIYFSAQSSINWGDMLFERCVIQAGIKAAVAVHHTTNDIDNLWNKCGFYYSPFLWFKETNNGNPSKTDIMHGSRFVNCQFENAGHAAICDDTATQAGRKATIFNTVISGMQFGWGGPTIAGTTTFSAIDVADMQGVVIDMVLEPYAFAPGTASTMYTTTITGGVRIRGDIENMFNSANTVPFVSGNWLSSYNRLEQIGTGPGGGGMVWNGRMVFMGTPAVVGSVVVASGGDQGASCAGNATEVPIGIVKYQPPSGNFCGLANSGVCNVRTTGTISAGNRLYTASSGAAGTTNTNAFVGVAIANVGTNLWTVALGHMAGQ